LFGHELAGDEQWDGVLRGDVGLEERQQQPRPDHRQGDERQPEAAHGGQRR
jgi:hypothetical protein